MESMEPKRVLYILGGAMKHGGTEAFIMNYYRNFDHNKLQIDFVYQGNEPGVYDEELLSYGSRIYHVPHKLQDPLGFSRAIASIISENGYKVVHSHMDAMSSWPLAIAKWNGVPYRIAHSHSSGIHGTGSNNVLKKMAGNVSRKLLRKIATDFYSCGEEAGLFLFGPSLMEAGRVRIVNNAIDLQAYTYDPEKRITLRKVFNIGEELVIGHVGRLSEVKNHKKLLEIFSHCLKYEPTAKLMLVGDGPLLEQLQQQAVDLGIREHVIFAGARSDVKDLLNIFDLFVFPSLFEGLSVVAIEAQANGIPCLFSDTIDKKTAVTPSVNWMSLANTPEQWASVLLHIPRFRHSENGKLLCQAGYDIQTEAKNLMNSYLEMCG